MLLKVSRKPLWCFIYNIYIYSVRLVRKKIEFCHLSCECSLFICIHVVYLLYYDVYKWTNVFMCKSGLICLFDC